MSAALDSPQTNPFPGLRPFREDEDHLFFGRENQVDAMVNKLADTRFLAVVGTSGSGKSSLVNCGLRPALRQGLMARSGTAWRMAQFRPGNDPIGGMARALAQDGVLFREHAEAGLTLAEIIETTLRMSKVGLIDICEQAGLGKGVNLLVVVDQFEELFRYRQLGAARRKSAENIGEDAGAFVNLLLEVKERATCDIYVVLTMRSDFLGDCTEFPGLAEAINAGQYLVPRMTRDERRAAIEGPIGVGGAEITPVLLTRLVNDVGDNPDQLSILQHALNRTWALWQSEGGKGPLDLMHYEAIGTMAHALDQHAEQAYAELGTTQQQQICEKLFRALTDKATDPRGVRRPTTLGELCALADAAAAEVADVVAVFRDPSRSFLMPPAGEALEAGTVIDISHESLMRVWQRLIKWTDEEARSARTYCRLADTADLHATGNTNLLRDPELQLALDWREKSQPNETWASRYHPGLAAAMHFLTESSEAREAERTERERQRQRELENERQKAEARARYARRMLWAAMVCGTLCVLAVGGGSLAWWAWSIAETKKAEAQALLSEMQITQSRLQITQSRSLAIAAEQNWSDQATRILLDLEALPDEKEKNERPVVFEAEESLTKGISDLRELAVLRGHTAAVNSLAVTPDGTHIVTGSTDSTARVWDATTGVELLRLKGHTAAVNSVVVTPDGTRIVTGSGDQTARVWDAKTGAELLQLKGHADEACSKLIAFLFPTGGLNKGREARLAELLKSVDPVDAVRPFDIARLAQYADKRKQLLDAAIRTNVIVATDPERQAISTSVETYCEPHVSAVAVTPDGARIVTGSTDSTARVWDATTGVELLQLKGHTWPVNSVVVTPDGTRIVTGSGDQTARVWDAKTGAELLRLKGHTAAVNSVAVTPDATHIVTGSSDHTARVWDRKTGAEELRLKGHTDAVNSVAVTPDGTRIVTGSGPSDNTARVWDARTGAEWRQLKGHAGGVKSVAVTPDGTRVATGSEDKTARVWDARTEAELLQLKGHADEACSKLIAFLFPTGDLDKEREAQLAELLKGLDPVDAVRPLDIARRAQYADKRKRLLDAAISMNVIAATDPEPQAIGTSVETYCEPHASAVAVTPDGTRIVTGSGSSDDTARVWDARTGAELLQLKGHADEVCSKLIAFLFPTGDLDKEREARLAELLKSLDPVDAVRPLDIARRAQYADKRKRLLDAAISMNVIAATAPEPDRATRALTSVETYCEPHASAVAVTPDGTRIVTGSTDSTAQVWDATTGVELLQLKGHTWPVNSVVVMPDGTRIVTGSEDHSARVWDALTGAELLQLKGHADEACSKLIAFLFPTGGLNKEREARLTELLKSLDPVDAVRPFDIARHAQYADKRKQLLDAAIRANVIAATDPEPQHPTRALTSVETYCEPHVNAVAVTPDGTRIVTGSSSSDNTARVWDARTGAELLQLKGHAGAVNSVVVMPDGTRIVTGSGDRTARVWDAQTGAELLQLKGHTQAVNSVVVTPDGTRVVTGSEDHTARVWDAKTGAELLRLEGHTVKSVAVTPDGGHMVTASDNETSRLWDLGQLLPPRVQYQLSTPELRQALIDHAKAVVPRCLTIEQRMSFLLSPRPPGWCIDMAKYPYDAKHWKAWKARKTADAVDSETADYYGNFADAAVKAGDFQIALEAAELGIQFGPEKIWIRANRAHALMFLNRIPEARAEYLADRNRGAIVLGEKKWEEAIVEDFRSYRETGRTHELMSEIENRFKPSLPATASR
jgi:WD40 repeat protein